MPEGAGASFDSLAALKAADPDRYVGTLFAPEQHRIALAALYLFNAETAVIRDRVSEPMPGEFRLQWWRDTIANGTPTGNPVADALNGVIALCGLPKVAFANLLEARIFDLYNDPMPDRAAFEGYAGGTVSILFQLAVQILNEGAVSGTADAAGHAGVAYCVSDILRRLPVHRARGQIYVPGDILNAAGLDADAFLSGEDKEACGRAVTAFAALAREHLSKAEAAIARLAPQLKVAFLPLAVVAPLLALAEKRGARALSEPLQLSALRRMWANFRRAGSGSR
jgi:phytoene synthase